MEDREIMVSISCITYNHAPYIRQCLDGFLMQKTNFNFEVLIHDDASIDGTTEIIKEYETRYPDIIKPMYEEENQWVKGRRGSKVFNFPRAKGKYIAMCEGDDYWIDPLKLQKQVDFLEENPNHSLCFHAYSKLFNDGNLSEVHQFSQDVIDVPKENMILGGGGYMATNSMLYVRKYYDNIPEWIKKAPVGDLPLMLLLLEMGKVAYINDNMSVYRILSLGSWSSRISNSYKKMFRHHRAIIKMWNEFDRWSGYKYHPIVKKKKFRNRKRIFYTTIKYLLK